MYYKNRPNERKILLVFEHYSPRACKCLIVNNLRIHQIDYGWAVCTWDHLRWHQIFRAMVQLVAVAIYWAYYNTIYYAHKLHSKIKKEQHKGTERHLITLNRNVPVGDFA